MEKTLAQEISPTKYAGFWIRFLALALDWFLFLGIIGYVLFGNEVTQFGAGTFNVNYSGWKLIIPFLYFFGFSAWKGATPGKMMCRIKIIETDGNKLSWQKALLRIFSWLLSAIAIGIGFLWAGFDAKKQSWHDKIAKTYVIKT
jgi:uncharacterized RDD family membrane protein YckC